MKVYAIFDTTAAVFGDPIISDNDNVARRSFMWTLGNPQLPDYVRSDSVLYCLGSFDRVTGMFTQELPPYVVMRGSSVTVRESEEVNSNEE